MSLRGQFFASVILALLVGLMLEVALSCWHARLSVDHEMAKALEAADRVVDQALLSLPAKKQDTYLAGLVNSFNDNRHVRVSLLEGGRVAALSRLAPPEGAPGWFVALLAIPTQTRRDVSPLLHGRTVLVTTDPHNEISEAWGQLRDGTMILLLFSGAVLGLLSLALMRVAAPLARLRRGFAALGRGHYDLRVESRGPEEFRLLAQDFNVMAGKLGALEAANRRLSAQMLAIQEEERADLARDLHDEMGPFLFAMRLDAEVITATAETPVVKSRARAITEALSHIQTHVRRILEQLRPEEEIDLRQALANLATFWERQHGAIAVHLDIAPDDFGADRNAAIFRLVQEGLTNAARHGGARHVWVAIAARDGSIHLSLEDDGSGLAPDREPGLGLKGMRERLASLGGILRLEKARAGGVRLQAEIPLIDAAIESMPA